MAQTALIAALFAGLLGGLHCAAMCGGWIAATARPVSGVMPLVSRRVLLARQLASHVGRLAVYAALGAALGAAGGAALAIALEPVQRALYVVANFALIVLALSMARRTATTPAFAEHAGLAAFARAAPVLTRFAARRPVAGPLALGALWGLTPCALVYGVLPVALLSGSAVDGATIMLAFGVGTLPNLLAAQVAIARLRGASVSPRWRVAAALVVALFGVAGIYRGVFVPDALASGAYCLVPTAMHGTLAAVPN